MNLQSVLNKLFVISLIGILIILSHLSFQSVLQKIQQTQLLLLNLPPQFQTFKDKQILNYKAHFQLAINQKKNDKLLPNNQYMTEIYAFNSVSKLKRKLEALLKQRTSIQTTKLQNLKKSSYNNNVNVTQKLQYINYGMKVDYAGLILYRITEALQYINISKFFKSMIQQTQQSNNHLLSTNESTDKTQLTKKSSPSNNQSKQTILQFQPFQIKINIFDLRCYKKLKYQNIQTDLNRTLKSIQYLSRTMAGHAFWMQSQNMNLTSQIANNSQVYTISLILFDEDITNQMKYNICVRLNSQEFCDVKCQLPVSYDKNERRNMKKQRNPKK